MANEWLGALAKRLREKRRKETEVETGRQRFKGGGPWTQKWIVDQVLERYGVSVSLRTLQRFEDGKDHISETHVDAIFGILCNIPEGEWAGFIARAVAFRLGFDDEEE